MNPDKPINIDFLILICHGCHRERKMTPEVPIHGAEELMAWLKIHPTACLCGAAKCDVKAHLMEEN